MKEKLKIGVLLNNYLIPAWEYKILKEIENSDFAKIVLIIKNISDSSITKKRKINSGSFIFRLHKKIDRLIFTRNYNYSRKKDISEMVKDVPEVVINPVEDGANTRFIEEDINEIKKYNLDIIIKFGFNVLKGDILRIPKYGIWSYPMCYYNTKNGVTAGYFEVVRKYPVTNSVLEILKEDSKEDTIIYSSWESTCSYSISLNRNKIFWRASLFMPRVMNGIYNYGDSYLNKLIYKFNREKHAEDIGPFLVPSFITAIHNFLISFVVLAQQICKKIFYSDAFNWMLLFKISDGKDVLINSYNSFIKLQSSKDKFWADPFIVSKNGRYFVFVEEFIYKTNKGHISVIELDDKGNFLSTERIIERHYHMSYPFIFELDNTYYMIPETSQNETIDLYKCTYFPDKWEFTKNIMNNLSALDTTLFYYKGKWWLFTSIDKTNKISGSDTELFLFFSDDIFSDNWGSHPNNPIVSDARIARPAGAIFIHEGKIFRPSQDCSGRYGKAFNLNQILTLTETEYEENLLSKVEPVWDNKLKGTHTFNFDKNFTVIDAYSYRKRISFK